MVNKPLIRPYFWGGRVRGGTLGSHDDVHLTVIQWVFPNGLRRTLVIVYSKHSIAGAMIHISGLTDFI